MKVAVITVTYNDSFKHKEWVEYFQLYKNELYLHIIVDNGSKPEYIKLVENTFSDSYLIKRKTNGGCTGAYNNGISYALLDKEVDAIMLIGNDIKLEPGGLTILYNLLFSKTNYGMVAPIILKKDSNYIESVGCSISKKLYLTEPHIDEDVNSLNSEIYEFEAVAGGMNLAKREFYEIIGLQDEKLFMYSDEVDMGLRAKKNGYKMAVSKSVKSWHQHINLDNSSIRRPYSGFLIARNKVYLAKKHFGFMKSLYVFGYQMKTFISFLNAGLFDKNKLIFSFYFLLGACCGLFGIMKNFKFIINN
jgi:GT2 family glycosyltransferase